MEVDKLSAYEMLCLDLDGTLLNSEHRISKKTAKTVRKISDKLPVILVSARPPAGIIPFQEELGLQEALIAYSGALILDREGNTIFDRIIPFSELQKLYINFKETVHISIYRGNNWYVKSRDYWAHQEAEITGLNPELLDFEAVFAGKAVDEGGEKALSLIDGANKVLCMGNPEEIQKISSRLVELLKEVVCHHSKPAYLEIMNKSVSKSAAIGKIAGDYGIKREEIIAVGDNFNDFDMIRYAGLGIAMGNAPDELKEAADEITADNNSDGVSRVIEKYRKKFGKF